MAELADVANETVRREIADYVERPDERERLIGLFVQASDEMQAIASALIEGDAPEVDRLTREALDSLQQPAPVGK